MKKPIQIGERVSVEYINQDCCPKCTAAYARGGIEYLAAKALEVAE